MKGKIAAATALVMLLLALGAEADLCVTHSTTYNGLCHSSSNCAAVCVTEHYTGGYCKGMFHGSCMCTKKCGGGGGGDGEKPPVAKPPPAEPVAPPVPVTPKPPVTPPVPAPPPCGCKPPSVKDDEKEASVEMTVKARRAGGHI